MSLKTLLVLCILALLAHAAMGESVIAKLKARVASGAGAAPCDKAPAAASSGPAPAKQFLDIRLPVVVDDYHAPVGGFNPSHIPDKEVDVAARKILREIQAADAEAKANGDEPTGQDENLTMTTEEHVAMKQLLLDADILVRAAAKLNAENGPITGTTPSKVAAAAVKVAAENAKKANAAAPAAPAAAPAALASTPNVGASRKPATKSNKAKTPAVNRKIVKSAPAAATKSARAQAPAAPGKALPKVKASAAPAAKSAAAASAGRAAPKKL